MVFPWETYLVNALVHLPGYSSGALQQYQNGFSPVDFLVTANNPKQCDSAGDDARRSPPRPDEPTLDKNQTVTVAKDQIHFAARGTKIGSEEFETASLQMLFRRSFAQFTVAQMERPFGSTPPPFDEF